MPSRIARAVTELILRGIFTVRQCEIDWFYQHGASMLFPDVWERFVAPIPQWMNGRIWCLPTTGG
jgi:proline iminopeptidase